MVFTHGAYIEYSDTVVRPVTTVPSNVIALIGTAPTYRLLPENVSLNEPRRLLGDFDDALYAGPKTPGFTIPHALDAIRDNNGGQVEMINVFDAAIHKTDAANVSYTFEDNDTIQLKQTVAGSVLEVNAEGLTGTTSLTGYTEGTDYTVNAVTGVITRVQTGSIPARGAVTATYTFADPSLVTPAEIIGAIVDGEPTGIQAVMAVYNLRGYLPKMILCPVYNEHGGVATELEAMAERIKALFFLDAPAGVTRDEVIAGRNGAAPVGTFGTNSQFAILCYPRVYASDGSLQPMSQYVAGVVAGTDATDGYWWSPSNRDINGIDNSRGTEVRLTASLTDVNTDVNALNGAGIVTIFKQFGSGYRVWGNRSAMWPSDSSPLNFIAVSRAFWITLESIQRNSLPFLDRPINGALVDQILSTAQQFIIEQIQIGALIPGSQVYWNRSENLNSQIAAGRLTFSLEVMVPTPMETLTYKGSLNIDLLSNIAISSDDGV